jgi:hypothetical protein
VPFRNAVLKGINADQWWMHIECLMQKFVHSKSQASSDAHSSLASHGVTEQFSETIEGHQHAETKRQTDTDKARTLVLIMIPALGLLQLALLYPLGLVGYLLILMGLLTGLAGIFTATRIYRSVIRFGLPVVAVLSMICGFVTVTNPSEDWVNGPRWLASRGAKMWEPELKTVREQSELFAVQQRMFTENSSHPRIKSTAGWLAPGAVTRVAKAPKMIRVETREKAEKLWKFLPRHKRKRGLRKSQGAGVSRISNRKSIHERPKVVEEKEELGHWEGDLMSFMKNSQHILVLRERKTMQVRPQASSTAAA